MVLKVTYLKFLEILDSYLVSRVGKIGDVLTPAMSIVNDKMFLIFENFSKLNDEEVFKIHQNEIKYFPHFISQYREEAVKSSIDEAIKEVEKGDIISISYYPSPDVYEALGFVKPGLVQIRNIYVKRSPKRLLEFLIGLRNILPVDTVLHVVSPIPWELIPFLIYVGVDIIDIGPFILKIRRSKINALIGYESYVIFNEINVQNFNKLTEREQIKLLEEKNKQILDSMFKRLRKSITKGKIRDLVEIFSHINQFTDAALAYLDNNFREFFENRVSLRKPKINQFIGLESFNRPLVNWYENRMRKRYHPPMIPKVIILLPCAARKPYSFSKSHIMFKKAITLGSAGKTPLIHEVMLTSPLGLVPRELEFTYPNAHYDTTTTGNWNEWELEHTSKMLLDYLNKVLSVDPNKVVIIHLEGGYKLAALRGLEKIGIDYIDSSKGKHATDLEALENLADSLKKVLRDFDTDIETRKLRSKEDAKAILSYQFGLEIAEKLLEGTTVIGNPVNKQGYIIKNNAVFDKDYGFFIPLKRGAEIISSFGKYTIRVEKKEFKRGENIRGNQILDADDQIHPGDIVVITDEEDNLIGSGISLFSGSDLKRIEESIAIKIIRVYQ